LSYRGICSSFDRSSLPAPVERLRTICIPEALWQQFTIFSAKNTAENKETGAVILGMVMVLAFPVPSFLQKNEFTDLFTVTTLFFAAQTAASDRFQFDADGTLQLGTFMERNPLLIELGMIHSHPRHPCFLSSVDIHQLHERLVGFVISMCLIEHAAHSARIHIIGCGSFGSCL
jgi:proteasome lid subunit RPN8/RPN11